MKESKELTVSKGRPKKCIVCLHPYRVWAENLYLLGEQNYREISEKLGCSLSVVYNHMEKHISVPAPVEVSEEAKAIAHAGAMSAFDDLTGQITLIKDLIDRVLTSGELKLKDEVELLLKSVDGLRKLYDSMARIFEIQQEQKKMDGTLNKLVIVLDRGDGKRETRVL